MAATNVMFSILAWTGKSEWLFALAVLLDDIAAAFATVAFVTFISLLVDRTYTATQYALLASIGTMGRTTWHHLRVRWSIGLMVIGGILHHHSIDGDTIADIALVYPKDIPN